MPNISIILHDFKEPKYFAHQFFKMSISVLWKMLFHFNINSYNYLMILFSYSKYIFVNGNYLSYFLPKNVTPQNLNYVYLGHPFSKS